MSGDSLKPTKPPLQQPNILFLDIETTPLIVDVWDTGKQYVGHDQILKDRSVLSWAAKWQHKPEIMYMDTRARRDKRDDKTIVKGLWKLIDQANAIVTQNGKRFDEKVLNARFEKHRIGIPSSYQHIDVYQIVKKKFKLPSYSLAYLTKYFGIEGKYIQRPEGYNGRALWRKCEAGELEAFDVMQKYNCTDISPTLEGVYERVKHWAVGVNYFNLNLFVNTDSNGELMQGYTCQCGSTDFWENGRDYLSTGVFKRWKCKNCGTNHRAKGQGQNLRVQNTVKV